MEHNFSDYINDSVRILIILGAVKDKKASDMTEQRIMLYDYYLKFPHTMMDSFDGSLIELQTLDEYYSFFHWQPDIIRYRQSINYLISKGFIEKKAGNKHPFFLITERGSEALSRVNSQYKSRMEKQMHDLVPSITKLSNTKIDTIIRQKSNILLRNGR